MNILNNLFHKSGMYLFLNKLKSLGSGKNNEYIFLVDTSDTQDQCCHQQEDIVQIISIDQVKRRSFGIFSFMEKYFVIFFSASHNSELRARLKKDEGFRS